MGDDTIRCGDPIDCNKLAEAWAGAASVDRAHVLMCLAGWARAGAFDEGAFVLNWGGPLSTEAAAQSLRRLAVAPDLTTLKLEEGTSPSNFDWPFLRLEALGRFCISRSIRPPPGLFTKEDPTAVHASPPPAPDHGSVELGDAVAWFERLVDGLHRGRFVLEDRVMSAKREARILLRATPDLEANDREIRARYEAARRRLATWQKSRGALSTGRPGRPAKYKSLIINEFKRAATAGEAERVLAAEARRLRAWLDELYADVPSTEKPVVKTIENHIRDRHRPYRIQEPRN